MASAYQAPQQQGLFCFRNVWCSERRADRDVVAVAVFVERHLSQRLSSEIVSDRWAKSCGARSENCHKNKC
jgi:hypothetical protein